MNTYVSPNAAHPSPVFERQHAPEDDGPVALLRLVLSLLLRHKWKLIAWIAASTAAAALYVGSVPYFYTTATTVLLKPREAALGSTLANAVPASLDISGVESEMEVIRSGRVLTVVFDSILTFAAGPASRDERDTIAAFLGEAPPPAPLNPRDQTPAEDEAWQRAFARFSRSLDIRRVGQSYVVSISCTANEPRLAARIANAVGSAYLLQSVEAKQVQAENGVELLAARLDAVTRQVGAARQAVADGVVPPTAITGADAQIISAARAPLEPSGPRKKLIIAFGAVLGLLSSTLVLALSHMFDRRIRTPADMTALSHLPCVVVPKAFAKRHWGKRRRDAAASVPADLETPFGFALRDLRTIVAAARSAGKSGEGRCIALVAWRADAGCSFLSRSLAGLVRDGGRQVTMIDAAVLREPSDDAVQDDAPMSLVEVLQQRIPSESVRFANRNGVAFLPATRQRGAGNHLVDLCSREMDRLVQHASSRGDVFLDAPPLSSTADGKVVARRADAVLLVARANRTRVDEVKLALNALREVDARLVGVVFNKG